MKIYESKTDVQKGTCDSCQTKDVVANYNDWKIWDDKNDEPTTINHLMCHNCMLRTFCGNKKIAMSTSQFPIGLEPLHIKMIMFYTIIDECNSPIVGNCKDHNHEIWYTFEVWNKNGDFIYASDDIFKPDIQLHNEYSTTD